MWGAAILSLVLGAAIMLTPPDYNASWRQDALRAQGQAGSFVTYRTAATKFAAGSPGFVGVVPTASLALPGHFVNQGLWTARMESGWVYVYGSPLAATVNGVLELMGDTEQVGLKQSGTLFSPLYGNTGTALPAWIPNGAIVSASPAN